ncbi:MAG: hypothetical protein ABSF54_17855 [Bryobacteraceae bacterium]|jgi:hypothetical protein
MPERDLQKLLAAAGSRVRGARVLLLRPRTCNLDECVSLFREAQGYLEWFRDSLSRAGPATRGLRHQATVLAAEIQQAGILLEQAARSGRRWLERLRAVSPEYTASGGRAPLELRGRISFLG